jgi:hypothetical protein
MFLIFTEMYSTCPPSYLELALDGKQLDPDTRENLERSHSASKVRFGCSLGCLVVDGPQALLFTINDLLVCGSR